MSQSTFDCFAIVKFENNEPRVVATSDGVRSCDDGAPGLQGCDDSGLGD